MLEVIAKIVWLLLPAYTPNNFAVLLGGGRPIDLGRNFIDGKRILGDGKTFRGFFGGVAGGIFVANVQYGIEKLTGVEIYSSLSYSEFFVLTFLLTLGAMLGDSVGSFLKRRFGYERGEPFPVVDQLTFLLISLAIASTSDAFWKLFDTTTVLLAIVITPPLHVFVNFLAYMLKLKEVPW
ncbi:MAG: CDP-2,3-bis-(O-geranylgeranyl)-sn-glycerol synthase [Archaeoglobaceae archaeon]